MPELPTRFIAKGMMQLSTKATRICTTVDVGYVVAVWLANRQGGGMVHLDFVAEDLRVDRLLRRQGAWALLWEFVNRLSALGRLEGAAGAVLGGADVLNLVPRHDHQLLAARTAGEIASFVSRYAIAIEKDDYGGEHGRRVTLALPEGEVHVEVLARRRPPGAPPSPAMPGQSPSGDTVGSGEVTIGMGDLHVDRSPRRLVTVLGSCVGVALYDAATAIGGLAHVMLPRAWDRGGNDARYADRAVPALVRAIAAAGGEPRRLAAKLAGGASMLGRREGIHLRVSAGNIAGLKQALAEAGIPILHEDLGGCLSRKMTVDLRDFALDIRSMGTGLGG